LFTLLLSQFLLLDYPTSCYEYYRLFDHPNIISCVDSTLKTKNDAFSNHISEVLIVLPYYKRGTLSDDLERKAKTNDHFPEKVLLKIFLGICNALKAMHELNPTPMAHRDLKTANVLLTVDYTPVLMDLGSMTKAREEVKTSNEAKRIEEEAAERSSMPYRAPELFNVEVGSTVDERTDIWSLGCVLYAMCFYKSPFDIVYERGDSVALAVVSGNVSIPDQSVYSQEINQLIIRILKVNPLERLFINQIIIDVESLLSNIENRV